MDNNLPITEFDTLTIPEYIQILKAAIPFLDINIQKHFSLIIRYIEFQNTVNFYTYADNILQFSSYEKNSTKSFNINNLLDNDNFINAVTPYIPSSYASIFKNIRLINSFSDLFGNIDLSKFNTSTANPQNSNDNNMFNSNILANLMSSGLSSSQQKLYDNYIKELDNLKL